MLFYSPTLLPSHLTLSHLTFLSLPLTQANLWETSAVQAAFSEEELSEHVAAVCSELGLPARPDGVLLEKAKEQLLAL